MGSTTFFKDGEWNFYCALCHKKQKSSEGEKTWDGHWVCKSHKEVRNPQDFLRSVRESLSIPWSKPSGPDIFIKFCTINSKKPIAGVGVAGCMLCGNHNADNAVAGFMIAGFAVARKPRTIITF